MKQKGFAPIIILVLLAVAIAGYFGYKYFNPENKVTTPLSTQTNSNGHIVNKDGLLTIENKFSFVLPKGWKYDNSTLTLGDSKHLPVQSADGYYGIVYITLADYLPAVYENNSSFKIISTKNINVDGAQAIKQIIQTIDGPFSGKKFTVIYIDKGDPHVRLDLHEDGYDTEFNQILSTFKFIQ